jgi:hypothetical protein
LQAPRLRSAGSEIFIRWLKISFIPNVGVAFSRLTLFALFVADGGG